MLGCEENGGIKSNYVSEYPMPKRDTQQQAFQLHADAQRSDEEVKIGANGVDSAGC